MIAVEDLEVSDVAKPDGLLAHRAPGVGRPVDRLVPRAGAHRVLDIDETHARAVRARKRAWWREFSPWMTSFVDPDLTTPGDPSAPYTGGADSGG